MSSAHISRRQIMKAIGATALSGRAAPAAAVHTFQPKQAAGAAHAPKICMGISSRASEAEMRRLKQLGVDHVLMGGPAIPWQESAIRSTTDRLKQGGLTVCNMMISRKEH